MKWRDRLRLAWRALRGGAPASKARKSPGGWTRPADTLTGWDGMLDDSTVLASQLRTAKRRAERAEDDFDDAIDDIECAAWNVSVAARHSGYDEETRKELQQLADEIEEMADLQRRHQEMRREMYR